MNMVSVNLDNLRFETSNVTMYQYPNKKVFLCMHVLCMLSDRVSAQSGMLD